MPVPIEKIHAREILDSRGNPTVEVEVHTPYNVGVACVPSGASTGTHEALELRDKDKRFGGKGVLKAVKNVNNVIAPKVVGMDAAAQRNLDMFMLELDSTENKSKLGANAILGVSMAAARAAAGALELPLYQYLGGVNAYKLPVPMMNVINGGKHAGSGLAIQEFLLLPVGADTYHEALRMNVETYHTLAKILKDKYGKSATNVGDEGGYAPSIGTTREALDAMMEAIDKAGYKGKIKLGIDSAASEFFKGGKYNIDGKSLSRDQMVKYYAGIVKDYPIIVLEDPFAEEDWDGFVAITKEVGKKVTVIGDDIYVTNVKRLQKGIDMGAANSLLLKLNQIGTVSEAFDAATLAFRNKYKVAVSHRSGETCDSIIADVAVALSAEIIKTGAPARSERTSKYNQLLRIEENLGKAAVYTKL
ncbi:enolase [Methanocella paludicola SANAE]|uniref:Enolase n=1 Tax=Methanocella paludicola (strain DSM 17711 / JCM 13418 / NBRC 101707 / SANAE) TaxID=304371 RepID=D1Z1G7_METPS|nr:phosphopyruvate hydratase [Methanocella paludicola]BAI62539.1 enolase [Methanocella paludicola SANAE]